MPKRLTLYNRLLAYATCFGLLIVLGGCATALRWTEVPFPVAQEEGAGDTPTTPNNIDEPTSESPPRIDGSVTETQPQVSPGAEAAREDLMASGGIRVVLQPYDTVRVRFLYWPELDDEQMIRPDGKISLLMAGDVEVQGKTPSELQKSLLSIYEPILNEPEINVSVSNFASNRVYVGGAVGTPGLIMLESRLTLLGAIMQAGGFREPAAKKSSVVVIRDIDGKQHARSVNLKGAIKHPESAVFYLQPYDIVYVPETKITHMNDFVAQYIDGLIPQHVHGGVSLGGRAAKQQISTGQGNSLWNNLPAFNIYSGK